jgi:hypothetical protein
MAATESTVMLSLTEYEASVLTGALLTHAEHWRASYPGDADTAETLREIIAAQCEADTAPTLIEAAARAMARKIDCNENRWHLYAHAAELALMAAVEAARNA